MDWAGEQRRFSVSGWGLIEQPVSEGDKLLVAAKDGRLPSISQKDRMHGGFGARELRPGHPAAGRRERPETPKRSSEPHGGLSEDIRGSHPSSRHSASHRQARRRGAGRESSGAQEIQLSPFWTLAVLRLLSGLFRFMLNAGARADTGRLRTFKQPLMLLCAGESCRCSRCQGERRAHSVHRRFAVFRGG